MTKIKVNQLPALTWHWLGVNDSDLTITLPKEAPQVAAGEPCGDFSLNTDVHDSAFDGIKTGMGEEFDALMKETKAVSLTIPAGDQRGEPYVLTVSEKDGQGAGRIWIDAGEKSEAAVLLCLTGEEEKSGDKDTLALQLRILAKEKAHLSVMIVQLLPEAGLGCVDIGALEKEGAKLDLLSLSLGAKENYLGIDVKLEGDKSSFSGDLGYRVDTGQNLDINYRTGHQGKKTESSLTARGVLADGAKKLFRGTIDFKEGAAGSVGAEKEEVLLMGEHQVNQTVPLILCHEEDVEGSHGATISRVKEETLFYLASRGIDRDTAVRMICRAALETVSAKIPDQRVRKAAERRIDGRE